MKQYYKILLITLILILPGISSGQLKTISVSGGYSFPFEKKIGVTEAGAVGGTVNINFGISSNLSIGLSGGYKLYSVSQENQLEGWEWRFWNERYSDKITSDLRADTNLAATISSVQKMDLIPLSLTLNLDIPLTEKMTLRPSVGGGIYFYTRRMYVVEDWSKYFPKENYVFSYSYRNFAPDKKGNPLFASFGLDFRYDLFEYAGIEAGARYNRVIPTEGEMGYDSFIFDDELKINLGFTFYY